LAILICCVFVANPSSQLLCMCYVFIPNMSLELSNSYYCCNFVFCTKVIML
jgi:hypothetical protein